VVARFATEARAVARINSEHVARVFDVGVLDSGAPFIVMELLTGSDLAKLLAERARFAPEVAVAYILQACEALAIAHSCGIVHRDIKPENLFLARTMQGTDVLKVLDFGISKLALTGSAVDSSPLVRTVAPLGSPVYMSPEQIRASSDIDARTDVWSIGCVLYELLAGKVAFDAPSITQLCAAILEEPAPSLRVVRGDIHPRLDAVIARCLEKRREHRYADVAELAVALMPFGLPSARVSVERCCYVMRKSTLPEAPLAAHDVAPSSWIRSSSGLSLSPATLDRADLIATAVEGQPSTPQPAARRAVRVAVGAIFLSSLVAVFWLGQSSVTSRGAAARGHDAPMATAAPPPAWRPDVVSTSASAWTAPTQAAPASSETPRVVDAQAQAPTTSPPKPEVKVKRAAPSPTRHTSRTLEEPDVGF
jgi:serine/threonine protein kinase